jgi:hypothetical protein
VAVLNTLFSLLWVYRWMGWSVCFYIDQEIPRVRAPFPACLVVRYFVSLLCDFWLARVLLLDWSVDLEWFLCTV